MTGCELGRCGPRRNCTDDPTAPDGYICGPCQPGYSLQAGRCADVDECVANVTDCVQPQQQCVNTDGGYECRCAPGYLQSRSDGTCVGMLGFFSFFTDFAEAINVKDTAKTPYNAYYLHNLAVSGYNSAERCFKSIHCTSPLTTLSLKANCLT